MRHERSFPWFGFVGLVYVVLFFWTSPIRSADITTFVPTAHVNAKIERQRLGPFYRFARYLNNSEGPFFQYTIFTNGTSFVIRPNSGMTAFALGNIQSVDSLQITRAPEETSHMRAEDDEYVNRREEEFNGVSCTYSHDDPAEEEALRKDTLCNTLLYRGKPFFRNNSPWFGWLDGLTLSDNGEWAMLRLSTGAYDAENIYLVDLRPLK